MPNNQRWRELCARAAVEQDPKKLMELVAEISRLFDEEHNTGRVNTRDDQPSATDDEGE